MERHGHKHLFLESNLNSYDRQLKLDNLRQRCVRNILPLLESAMFKDEWSKNYFSNALETPEANFGEYCFILKEFSQNMLATVDCGVRNSRLIRPRLIKEIINMCQILIGTTILFGVDRFDDEIISKLTAAIRIFRKKSQVAYNTRETIVRNFILEANADPSKYSWPKASSYKERIVAIILQGAIFYGGGDDDERNHDWGRLCCRLMGFDYENNTGTALRAYSEGKEIVLGTNQHRVQALFYNMINDKRSMPGLTTEEYCFFKLLPQYIGGLFNNVNLLSGLVLSDTDSSLAGDKLYTVLYTFTHHRHTGPPSGKRTY